MYRYKSVCSLLVSSSKVLFNINGITNRTLFAPAAMGMDGYMHSRERTKLQINNIESFKAKMQEFVDDKTSKNLIFTEDLKNMLHISEKADIPLLTQMILKFSAQSKEARFGNFIFGPPVMRTFYHLQDIDTALEMFINESLNGFFDQPITYHLLLDLLYKKQRYQDVLDTFEIIKQRQVLGSRYRNNIIILSFAACYQLNTSASFEFANNLWKEMMAAGVKPARRAVGFIAALALKQNAPDIALEILTSVRPGQQNYITIRTIKALAYAHMKRYDDSFQIIRLILEIDNPMVKKNTFPKDSIEELKILFADCTSNSIQSEFAKTVGFIEKRGHVTNETLDDILTSEIQPFVNDFRHDQDRDGPYNGERHENYRRDYRGSNYRGENRDGFGGYGKRQSNESRHSRPGLHELN